MRVVLLPLPAFQPLPARLRPLGGPGELADAHAGPASLRLVALSPVSLWRQAPLWRELLRRKNVITMTVAHTCILFTARRMVF